MISYLYKFLFVISLALLNSCSSNEIEGSELTKEDFENAVSNDPTFKPIIDVFIEAITLDSIELILDKHPTKDELIEMKIIPTIDAEKLFDSRFEVVEKNLNSLFSNIYGHGFNIENLKVKEWRSLEFQDSEIPKTIKVFMVSAKIENEINYSTLDFHVIEHKGEIFFSGSALQLKSIHENYMWKE